jgi:hypothetical protein
MALEVTVRERVWLVAVAVFGIAAGVLFFNNLALRADLKRGLDAEATILLTAKVPELRGDVVAAGDWLHTFYQSDDGLKRPRGLWIGDRPDFEAIGVWLFDVYFTQRLRGATDAAARQVVVERIQQSDEWRQKHPERR